MLNYLIGRFLLFPKVISDCPRKTLDLNIGSLYGSVAWIGPVVRFPTFQPRCWAANATFAGFGEGLSLIVSGNIFYRFERCQRAN